MLCYFTRKISQSILADEVKVKVGTVVALFNEVPRDEDVLGEERYSSMHS